MLPDLALQNLKSVPIERAETIPSSWYSAPGFYEFDNRAVFSRSWHWVGHASKVQAAGDYLVATVADNPILVVRGNDDKLRSFYNVCRHRAGPLATQDGHAKVLQCQYHGWTYKLDGSLRGVPEFDRVELFDRKDYGLIPIQLDVWEGFIFVTLSDHPEALHSVVDGIAERVAPNRLKSKQFARRMVYDLNCNWKVYIDNYLEGYHLPYVHPELCNILDYQKYVTEVAPYYSLQHSPLSESDNLYQRNDSEGEAYYYFIFPNLMLNILPGRLQVNLVVPVAHDRTRVIFEYYYDDTESPEALDRIEQDVTYSDQVQKEDMEICEYVQKGLCSKAYDRGRFSVKCEQGVYHFQNLLKQSYRSTLEDERMSP